MKRMFRIPDLAAAGVGVIVVMPALSQWSSSFDADLWRNGWWALLETIWMTSMLTLAIAGAVSIARSVLQSGGTSDGTEVVTKGEFEGRQRIIDK